MFSKLYASSPLLCGEADGGSELAGEVIALLMGDPGLGIVSDKEVGRGMLFQRAQIEGTGGGGGRGGGGCVCSVKAGRTMGSIDSRLRILGTKSNHY